MDDAGKRTILVVEDNELNREILCEILSDDYKVLQAEDGREGISILKENRELISLVLLDITMPVMDGYGFLDCVREDQSLSMIPIIVTTASDTIGDEIRCLENGASDFVTKPYNPEIVCQRVKSMIRLREASAMLALVEKDSLTGLYSKEFFYEYARRTMEANPELRFDLICSDIENFKMINDRQGRRKGDEILKYLAGASLKLLGPHDVHGRIGADVFVYLMEHMAAPKGEALADKLNALAASIPASNVVVNFGICENVDHNIPIQDLCDRARMAVDNIRGRYGVNVIIYKDSFREKRIREQMILDGMEQALAERQFVVYYQPKHDLKKNCTGGAEALVRWIHPEYGFMNPGEFISLFERNGFIAKLDYYVWEEVCRSLKEWGERGIFNVPISINVSRVDFEDPNLDEVIERLADRYGVDHALIHPEVTESAYANNPKQILDTVDKLRKRGFKLELDDFGSGYSSLDVLDEMPFDVLKLDMRLIRKMASSSRTSVLTFVFNIANWLKVDTVAEGVETVEQVSNLMGMDCTYAQGYYFARPMPKVQFEEYILKEMGWI